jgi:hypothetical protein
MAFPLSPEKNKSLETIGDPGIPEVIGVLNQRQEHVQTRGSPCESTRNHHMPREKKKVHEQQMNHSSKSFQQCTSIAICHCMPYQ